MYDTQHSSPTAIACEQAELFGATPGPDEPDNRDLWDQDDAMHAVDSAFHAFAGDIARDGTQLADERESFLWGFVNLFHAQVNRLDRAVDALKPKLRDLQRAQDGTEINAYELERTVDRARALGDRRDAFEKMRDHAADAYRTETGSTWRPRRGSHVSQTRKMTAAAIDARDFLRAREHRANEAHLPDGTLVAVAGGKEAGNVNAICTALDRVKERHPDMVLLHGGGAHRGALGRQQRGAPGGVPARLGRPRPRRSLPAQRPAPQAPPDRARRLPRRRNQREPRRQGARARDPGRPIRRLTRITPRRVASLPRRRGPFPVRRPRTPAPESTVRVRSGRLLPAPRPGLPGRPVGDCDCACWPSPRSIASQARVT